MGIEELILHLAEEKGFKIGVEKASHLYVTNLLSETDLPIVKIASLVGVTQYFVRKVKKEMKAKSPSTPLHISAC